MQRSCGLRTIRFSKVEQEEGKKGSKIRGIKERETGGVIGRKESKKDRGNERKEEGRKEGRKERKMGGTNEGNTIRRRKERK
jgi:hypothetical protein